MALDCVNAFNQEMEVLNTISSNLKIIGDKILENNPADNKAVLDEISLKVSENQIQLKETNRLLKLLCVGILGKVE
ncbi:hypothetical protein [Campylobacter sp. RM16187]|uniref:hypothetical protein n=1 Tax=Campylobacter sp. RM16187 TaxID=1660063 RepID=UPI0021B64968|nr:hypothetical protein [Campylobacter sp. RM16187]QKG28770.1 hypothetical protein CDOMF_0488 [Campylobacter sp. RM16187]